MSSSIKELIKIENEDIIKDIGPVFDRVFGALQDALSGLVTLVQGIFELDFYQESDGNSGVFFRSTIEGTLITGWQVEFAPHGLHSGGIYESYGRGWLIKPDSK